LKKSVFPFFTWQFAITNLQSARWRRASALNSRPFFAPLSSFPGSAWERHCREAPASRAAAETR